jgi:hypothetical protein
LARWAFKVSEAWFLIWKEAAVEAVVAVEAAVVVAVEVVEAEAVVAVETEAGEVPRTAAEAVAAVGKESIRQVDRAEARLPRKKGLPTKEMGFVWPIV